MAGSKGPTLEDVREVEDPSQLNRLLAEVSERERGIEKELDAILERRSVRWHTAISPLCIDERSDDDDGSLRPESKIIDALFPFLNAPS